MALHTSVAVTSATAYVCVNPSNSAAGATSFFAVGNPLRVKVGSTTTIPTDDLGSIVLPSAETGGGWINQTLAAMFPGATTPTYIFAKLISGSAPADASMSLA